MNQFYDYNADYYTPYCIICGLCHTNYDKSSFSTVNSYNPFLFMREASMDNENLITSRPAFLSIYYTRSTSSHFTVQDALEVGTQLGIRFDKFDVDQFRIGMDVELEHGTVDPHTNVTDDDALMTGKIALAHLNEFPDYYKRLVKMEEEAEEYWESKEK